MWLLPAALFSLVRPALADCEPCTAALCPGDLVVSEFMADPSFGGVPNYNAEWFEVYNASTANLNLNGLVVESEGDPGFTVTGDLFLQAGAHLVFGVNADRSSNGNVPIDYEYEYSFTGVGEVALRRASDSIVLVYAGAVVDEVSWNNAEDWDVAQNQAHHVNGPLLDNGWANDLAHNWCRYVGTNAEGWGGTPGEPPTQLCSGSSTDDDGDGFSETDGDCDDTNDAVNPDAVDGVEAPHGVAGDDADCDGRLDDGVCDDDGDTYTEVSGDCDDDNPAKNPGQTEIPDGVDNDCNGCIDDLDDDEDGWSDCDVGEVVDCDADDDVVCDAEGFDPFSDEGPLLPDGYREGDCAVAYDTNNDDRTVFPCAEDIRYDGVDQSGDGFDDCDRDNDGFDSEDCAGAPDPGFWSDRDPDCDDNDPSVYPGGDEGDPDNGGVRDGKDNDCNGTVDDPYQDADLDGYDLTEGDCLDDPNDPRAPQVNPGAPEVCNDGLDNDCNGFIDDGCSDPAVNGSVRGGGLCTAVAGPLPPAGGVLVSLALFLSAARRRLQD